MFTCFNFAEKASANPKNKSGIAAIGRIVPKTLNPELNSPIPNILNKLPIAKSAQNAERHIPIPVPMTTTMRNLRAKENRSLSDDIPKLL